MTLDSQTISTFVCALYILLAFIGMKYQFYTYCIYYEKIHWFETFYLTPRKPASAWNTQTQLISSQFQVLPKQATEAAGGGEGTKTVKLFCEQLKLKARAPPQQTDSM